ncbi:ATP-binding protein, partial [Chloroflexota bacterium]
DGERIQKLNDAADVKIYTPGSNSGLPVSILSSFEAPPKLIVDDSDLFNDRINTTVSSLLGLVGIKADPVQSREHILLSTLFNYAWKKNQTLDLGLLISLIQEPPLKKIGVLDLESFFPSKDRFSLVLAINNLIASPGFSTWLEGVPLDINQILYTPDGKPSIAIFSIAHLSDPEKMFFVSLLMNQVLGWTRSQSGTTSLRALVYMDEIFGFLPPVENPPSKQPMLTMLKQARAFGVGMVLATQNPVDLDYKALSNAGTWFVGRLQTEQDKSRLLDGLETISKGSAALNRKSIDKIISRLKSRVFLVNNTHEPLPEIFHTRWALSYLRGPLTRDGIRQLMEPIKIAESQVREKTPTESEPFQREAFVAKQPSIPPNITDYFVPTRGSAPSGSILIYQPKLIGVAKLTFQDRKKNINETRSVTQTTVINEGAIPVDWDSSEEFNVALEDLDETPQSNSEFLALPTSAASASNYKTWQNEFSSWLYGSQSLNLLSSPSIKVTSLPGESEQDFRLRLKQLAREKRDELSDNLRDKYVPKHKRLQEKLRKAEQAVEKQEDQAKKAKYQVAVSIGSTILGALSGRKISQSTISKASTAMKSASRTLEESRDVNRAEETVESIKKQISDLEAEFKADIDALDEKIDPQNEELDVFAIKPRKSDISIQLVSLIWVPHWRDSNNSLEPAF